MSSASRAFSTADLEAALEFVKRLYALELADAGAAAHIMETVHNSLTKELGARFTPNYGVESASSGRAKRSELPSTIAVKPTTGVFEAVSLEFLKQRGSKGATRAEIRGLFKGLNFDVGNDDALASRLNARLRGGAANTIGYATWENGQQHARITITAKGRERLESLLNLTDDTTLSLDDRDALMPRLEAALNVIKAGGG